MLNRSILGFEMVHELIGIFLLTIGMSQITGVMHNY